MNQTKHTPGPWRLHEKTHDRGLRPVVTSSRGGTIATCGGKSAHDIANARLIATAPELLSALEQGLAEWDASDGRVVTALTADLFRAVIAKAQGS